MLSGAILSAATAVVLDTTSSEAPGGLLIASFSVGQGALVASAANARSCLSTEVPVAEKTVAEKGRVKPGTALAILNPVQSIVASLGLPPVDLVDLPDAQLVFLFVRNRTELESEMPPAVAGMAPDATLWVFFCKGSKASGLDMNRDDVWALAEAKGLRPLGLVSVDQSWSAFRFRA